MSRRSQTELLNRRGRLSGLLGRRGRLVDEQRADQLLRLVVLGAGAGVAVGASAAVGSAAAGASVGAGAGVAAPPHALRINVSVRTTARIA